MNAIFELDRSILLWIQENVRAEMISPAVKFITHLGDAGIFWIVLTIILMCFRKTRRAGVTSAIAMVIGLLVVNVVLKNWVARIRPYVRIEELHLMVEPLKDFSFPSGHSSNAFASAWALWRTLKKRWGVPALVLAALIALSRLYVGAHYPTDVLAGVVIGILSAELAVRIVRLLRRRFKGFRRFISKKKPKRAGRTA